MIFEGLPTELLGAAIYDLAKGIFTHVTGNEWVQTTLKKLGIKEEQNDFASRYLESIVELKILDKDPAILNLFREKSISKTFYDYYYGTPSSGLRSNLKAHKAALDHCIAALKVGDEIKAHKIDVEKEVNGFWEIFKQKIQESRPIQNVEIIQEIRELKSISENCNSYKIPKLLTKSPTLPEFFLGREEDLKAIRKKLSSGDNMLLLVNGHGGVGKSSIATKYYITHQNDYAHTAYMVSGGSIANALLYHLSSPLGLEFNEKESETERINKLLLAMANLEKPSLLVIDNVDEIEDLQKNYQLLRSCINFHMILTSRIQNFRNASCFKILSLPENLALDLFQEYYQPLSATERSIFTGIYNAVEGNTLVIEVLAKNLKLFNRTKSNYTLAELLSDLQSQGLLGLTHTVAIEVDYQSKNNYRKADPKDIIGAMYDINPLSETERKLLSAFAVLPSEGIPIATIESLLMGLPELRENAYNLNIKGWLDYYDFNNEYKCHPVIQEIIRTKNNFLLDDCDGLIKGLMDKLYPNTLHEDNYFYSTIFARYAVLVVNHIKIVDYNYAVLFRRIGKFYQETGLVDQALIFFEDETKLFKELYDKFPNNVDFKEGLAISCSNLGDTHTALGDLDQALIFFKKYFDLFNELNTGFPKNVDFKRGLAISYSKLGDTYFALGTLDEALFFFEKYFDLFYELNTDFPNNIYFQRGLAISNEKLGDTYTALGELDQALIFFKKETKLFKELYENYPNNLDFKRGLAISYSKLGVTHSELGDLEQAMIFFEKYFYLQKELNADFPNNVDFKRGLAISYSKLGDTHSALGDLEQALIFFEKYFDLNNELNADFPNNVNFKRGLAISYSKLGDTHSALGEIEQALTFYDNKTKLFKELYADFPNNVNFKSWLAISYSKLGVTHSELGDLGQALIFFEKYFDLNKEIIADYPNNVNFKRELAISYDTLGDTHFALGNLVQALIFFDNEAKIFEEIYADFPNNVNFKNSLAISYLKLGSFYNHKESDKIKAMDYFTRCKKIWVELAALFPINIEFKNNLAWVEDRLNEM